LERRSCLYFTFFKRDVLVHTTAIKKKNNNNGSIYGSRNNVSSVNENVITGGFLPKRVGKRHAFFPPLMLRRRTPQIRMRYVFHARLRTAWSVTYHHRGVRKYFIAERQYNACGPHAAPARQSFPLLNWTRSK